MLAVTENAKQLLMETLLAHTDDPEIGLRLVLEPPGRLGLVLSKECYGDQVVEYEGAKVLLVAPELETLVDETILDAQDTPDGPNLAVLRE
jgi:Fe-S cluster assembly iron-binding protein IscA